jgi:hypothetical protein
VARCYHPKTRNKKGSQGSLLICSEADRLVAVATTEAATATAAFTTTTASTAAAVGATETAATLTTATTVAATAFTATEATCAGRTWFHGASFVYHEATATQRCTIHAFDGSLRFGIAAHFDETKTFRAASIALHHDLGASHRTELSERLLKITITHGIRQVADVQFVAHERDSLKHKNKAMESRTETDRSPNTTLPMTCIHKVAAIMEHKLTKLPSVYLYLAQFAPEKPQLTRLTSWLRGRAML